MPPETDVSRKAKGLPTFCFKDYYYSRDGLVMHDLLPCRILGIPRIALYEPREDIGVRLGKECFLVREVSRSADRQDYRLWPSSGETAGGKYLSAKDPEKGFVLGIVVIEGQICVYREEQVHLEEQDHTTDSGFKGDIWVLDEQGLTLVGRDVHCTQPILKVPPEENLVVIPCLGANKGVILAPSRLITQPSMRNHVQIAINRLAERARLSPEGNDKILPLRR